MRRVRAVQFVQSIAVFETGRLADFFDSGEHWVVETSDMGGEPFVRLSRPAVPEKNVPAVKSFVVRGVGFMEPSEGYVAEQTSVSRDGAGADAAAAADQRTDAGRAPEAAKPAQGGPKKAKGKVT